MHKYLVFHNVLDDYYQKFILLQVKIFNERKEKAESKTLQETKGFESTQL